MRFSKHNKTKKAPKIYAKETGRWEVFAKFWQNLWKKTLCQVPTYHSYNETPVIANKFEPNVEM